MQAPALGFFKIAFQRYSLVSNHFQYFGAASLIALAAAGAVLVARRLRFDRKPLGYALAGVTLLVLGAMSFERARAYHSIVTLAADTLSKNDRSWVSLVNLGVTAAKAGEYEQGIGLLRRAYEIEPQDYSVRYNLGLYLLKSGTINGFAPGQLEECTRHLQEAVGLKQTSVAYAALGAALLKSNRPREAVESFEAGLRLQPPDAAMLVGIAGDLEAAGQPADAISYYERALKLDPQSLEIHYRLGLAPVEARSAQRGRLAPRTGCQFRSCQRRGSHCPRPSAVEIG